MKATKVTTGLAESNGSLLPVLWRDSLHITCGLTACTPESAPGPTLGDEYGKTTFFYVVPWAHMRLNSNGICHLDWCIQFCRARHCAQHTQMDRHTQTMPLPLQQWDVSMIFMWCSPINACFEPVLHFICITVVTVIMPSVLWHCWLGGREGIGL